MTVTTENVSTSFKLPVELDRLLPLLAEIHGFDGKSEYIRHLILSDLEKQKGKAALYTQLIGQVDGNS